MKDRLHSPRIPAPLAFWVAVGLALLVSHDAIWLVQVGPGERLAQALRSAGHGYWAWVSIAILAGGTVAAIGAGVRLVRLRRRAGALGAPITLQTARHRDRATRAWLRLATLVAIGFVVQENAEHFIAHGHLPGLGALAGPEYPLAIPVIATITGLAALVLRLVSRVEQALVAAIASAMASPVGRAPALRTRPSAGSHRRSASALAEPGASRAPPSLDVIASS